MKYHILSEDYNLSLIDRLLKIRNITDKEKFLNPTWQNSRYDPFLLSDMDIAIEKIIKSIKNNDRIVVFGDYDVDGVTSTYVLFYFIYKFLNYKNISIRLPSREDGYGIRGFHLDELKEKNVKLVITVDNGITAIQEAEYAKKLGLDLIITDHHTPLEQLPSCDALVNPKTSPNYPFSELAGVGVAFKLVTALANKLNLDKKLKQKILNYFLPIVAIGTVADCVPLVDENRFLVKKGLEIINDSKKRPPNIDNMINYLNLKNVDSYHIGFVIGPRLNASGRIHKPDNSFHALFQHNPSCQTKYLDLLEEMNIKRQSTQSDILSEIEKNLDTSKKILFVYGDFHEGVIGIVAGRLTEKYNKPAIVMSLQKEKGEAVASCRSPMWFSIIDLLNFLGDKGILERYGGHQQAGGLTVKIDNIPKIEEFLLEYEKNLNDIDTEKVEILDTCLQKADLLSDDIYKIDLLAPFGEQNPAPKFLLKNVEIKKIDLVGKKQNHLKIYGQMDGVDITLLKWSGVSLLEKLNSVQQADFIVSYAKDDFKGGFYFKIIDFEPTPGSN